MIQLESMCSQEARTLHKSVSVLDTYWIHKKKGRTLQKTLIFVFMQHIITFFHKRNVEKGKKLKDINFMWFGATIYSTSCRGAKLPIVNNLFFMNTDVDTDKDTIRIQDMNIYIYSHVCCTNTGTDTIRIWTPFFRICATQLIMENYKGCVCLLLDQW